MQLRRVASVLSVLALSACASGDGRTMTTPVYPPPETTTATSVPGEFLDTPPAPAPLAAIAPWTSGADIPARFTCDGDDVSPAISWSNVPAGSVEMAVTMTDLDAEGFAHWIVTGIDPYALSIAEGELPVGAVPARNSWGFADWAGPCPPDGDPHTYLLTVYALSEPAIVGVEDTPAEIETFLITTAIGTASVSGTYQRPTG